MNYRELMEQTEKDLAALFGKAVSDSFKWELVERGPTLVVRHRESNYQFIVRLEPW